MAEVAVFPFSSRGGAIRSSSAHIRYEAMTSDFRVLRRMDDRRESGYSPHSPVASTVLPPHSPYHRINQAEHCIAGDLGCTVSPGTPCVISRSPCAPTLIFGALIAICISILLPLQAHAGNPTNLSNQLLEKNQPEPRSPPSSSADPSFGSMPSSTCASSWNMRSRTSPGTNILLSTTLR